MSSSLLSNLGWLPHTPADFTAQCRALLQSDEDAGPRLRALANFSLDENQLYRLAQTTAKLRQSSRALKPLKEQKLGVLSNATTDFLIPAITATSLRHGIAAEVMASEYGQVLQAAVDPESKLNTSRPDVVLIAVDHRFYPFETCFGDADRAAQVCNHCISQLESIRQGIKQNSGAICIFQTVVPPADLLFGSLDRALPGTVHFLIDSLNRRIAEMVSGTEDVLFDVAGLAEIVGLATWHDPTSWNLAKLPFNPVYLPLYADHVGRILAALNGKSRRCLVLDLDNTVWGGVIGDDGLEGIQIAQGDATGEAFLEVQRIALALRSRGIVLAVSSKNTDEIARKPFQHHPEMLLKLDHIAVFQANWNDKATNIKAIAEELNLGLESLVFLDDNPVERNLVREMLPQVAVPELPSDPALYARTLLAAGYFESIRFLDEDRKRADFYQDNSRRVALQQQAGDLDAYLASLDMEIVFQPFDETGRARIAQLINKSNQFNLTTHRYTETDVAAFQTDPSVFTLQVRLRDRFGDNGMISVIICKPGSEKDLEIDTWLMSCRVLGRKVENMVLQEIAEYGAANGFERLIGKYIPTERNALVRDHYRKLGFTRTDSLPDGTTIWAMNVADAPKCDAPMRIRRIESGAPSAVLTA